MYKFVLQDLSRIYIGAWLTNVILHRVTFTFTATIYTQRSVYVISRDIMY